MARKKTNNTAPRVYTQKSLEELNRLLCRFRSASESREAELRAQLDDFQLTLADGAKQQLFSEPIWHRNCSHGIWMVDLRRFVAEGDSAFKNLQIRADFRKAYLYRTTFDGCHLYCDFRGAHLRRARFNECSFEGSNFQGAFLWRSVWIGKFVPKDKPSYPSGFNERDHRRSNAVLSKCNLKESYFFKCDMRMFGISHSDVSYAFFDRCYWNGVSLQRLATCTGWETVRGLPPGMYADLVAMGYRPKGS